MTQRKRNPIHFPTFLVSVLICTAAASLARADDTSCRRRPLHSNKSSVAARLCRQPSAPANAAPARVAPVAPNKAVVAARVAGSTGRHAVHGDRGRVVVATAGITPSRRLTIRRFSGSRPVGRPVRRVVAKLAK